MIDSRGSMGGFPIETAKKAMQLCIEGMHDKDTFKLITFSGGTVFVREADAEHAGKPPRALQYRGNPQGSGGTEMMKAINACLAGQDDPSASASCAS